MYLQAKILEFQCQSLSLLIQAEAKLYPDGKWRESTTGEFCSPPGGEHQEKFERGIEELIREIKKTSDNLAKIDKFTSPEAKEFNEKLVKGLNRWANRLEKFETFEKNNIENLLKAKDFITDPRQWQQAINDLNIKIQSNLDDIKAQLTWENARKVFSRENLANAFTEAGRQIRNFPAIAKEAFTQLSQQLTKVFFAAKNGFFDILNKASEVVHNFIESEQKKWEELKKDKVKLILVASSLALSIVYSASNAARLVFILERSGYLSGAVWSGIANFVQHNYLAFLAELFFVLLAKIIISKQIHKRDKGVEDSIKEAMNIHKGLEDIVKEIPKTETP